MDNPTFTNFDEFLYDIQSRDSGEPRSLEQIKASWPKGPTDAERCRQLAKDAPAKRPPDWFEVEEIVAQTRILKAINEPVVPFQTFNAATGEPLGKGAESKPVGDDLMRLLTWSVSRKSFSTGSRAYRRTVSR